MAHPKDVHTCIQFQFQNGAIKSRDAIEDYILPHIFQFQNGAIKRSLKNSTLVTTPYFNSKMVRLKENREQIGEFGELISIPKWCD